MFKNFDETKCDLLKFEPFIIWFIKQNVKSYWKVSYFF